MDLPASSPSPTPIDRLRELARRLEDREPLDELGLWLLSALDIYFTQASHGLTLEAALGLEPPPGRRKWWTEQGRALRDEEIRAAANRYFEHLKTGEAAKEIARIGSRYLGGRWRLDRDREEMPEGYRGTPHEHFWKALRACDGRLPTSSRHIRRILEQQ